MDFLNVLTPTPFQSTFQAECIRILLVWRSDIHITLEQPAQSWGFKIPAMLALQTMITLPLGHVRFCFVTDSIEADVAEFDVALKI